MKKTAIFTLALFLAAVLLCGCGKVDTPDNGHDNRFMFLNDDGTIDGNVYLHVVVDTKTGVEYVWSARGFMCPIIDSYGNPYIYPAFDAREDKVVNP